MGMKSAPATMLRNSAVVSPFCDDIVDLRAVRVHRFLIQPLAKRHPHLVEILWRGAAEDYLARVAECRLLLALESDLRPPLVAGLVPPDLLVGE